MRLVVRIQRKPAHSITVARMTDCVKASAAPAPKIKAMPGKITNITERFGGFTCEAFKKQGFRQVGYWLNRVGGNDHQLVYMPAWESLNERVAKFDTFAKDPDRARVFGESEKNGPIVEQVTTTILRPTAFSPMK